MPSVKVNISCFTKEIHGVERPGTLVLPRKH